MLPDVASFEASPNDANFEKIHGDISEGGLTQEAEVRIINRLALGSVPANVVNATVADLATVDLQGSLHLVRAINVTAQINAPKNQHVLVTNTASLAWIFLALRPYNDTTALDLSHMDLRSPVPGQAVALDLHGANLMDTRLPGGLWNNFDLTDSLFDGAVADSRLECKECTWGKSARATLQLIDGKWVTPG